ncbi:SIMPL domain-containing protein [Xanthobacter sp. TB0136]|uniref:SIMPL domain-containing protein n=1 Tax=Xanthobacter sp. TB0136 TaxID=3459177 RepID=UPI00403A2772
MRSFPVLRSSSRLRSMAVLASLGLGVAAFAPVAAQAATVKVVGEATLSAVPDMASFSTGVVTTAKTAADAMQQNSKAVAAVIAAVKEAGIEARDISTNNFSVQPQYVYPRSGSNEKPRLTGFEVRNTVQVRVRDLSVLGGLLDKMVEAGANEASGLSFTIADRAKLMEDARVAAVENAVEQAKRIAEAAGLRLTRVLSVEPLSVQVPPMRPMVMMARAEAQSDAVPVEAGEIDVSAQAVLVYEAEPR